MKKTETVVVPASPAVVFPHVARLDAYPAWLPLVHAATPVDEGPEPAWSVELRARVGRFARSKQLRMRRTIHDPDRIAAFERDELDGRDHARWALRSELAAQPDGSTLVTMHLAYDGSLWTDVALGVVLDEEVRRGQAGLVELVRSVSGDSRH